MKPNLTSTAVAVLLLAATSAQGASLKFGIGVRETGTDATIGADGGTTGGIEWVDRGLHAITDNGVWQTISINLATGTVQAFAGATADNVLSSASGKGVLESLRIDIADVAGPFKLYLDNLTYTDAAGGSTLISGWEGLAAGAEHIFQEPKFSGSTAALVQDGATSQVVTGGAGNGSDSAYEINFSWVDDTASNWLRLTTANFNPTIGLDGIVSFDVRLGDPVPEPASLAFAALASGLLLRRRR